MASGGEGLENPFDGLPGTVFDAIGSALYAEFATLTAQGAPIDTPANCFLAPNGRSLDVSTGLAYPIKAERARRNPKVGLFLEAGGGPVVGIAAIAAVRDADLTANALRYISETAAYPYALPWSKRREAIWYWTRIIVECHPQRIFWWESREALDKAPRVWRAAANAAYPVSDPAPLARGTPAPAWGERDWREAARNMIAAQAPAHLSAVDDEGFPLPVLVRSVAVAGDSLEIDAPRGAPWRAAGHGSLTFGGRATFVGRLDAGPGGGVRLSVERMLPVLPMVDDPEQVFEPVESTRSRLLERLQGELERRGGAVPPIPETEPEPTAGSLRRWKTMESRAATLAHGGE